MDLITTPTTTNNHTPDTENETPPAATAPPNKSLSFTNGGAVKKHSQIHHHSRPPAVVVTYKECLKNHAASLGGHAVDGCGEFMPSPTDNPTDPTSLKCAACGCHRNFHRREDDPNTHFLDFHRHFLLLPPPPHRISPPFSSPSPSPSPPTPPPPQQQQPSYYSTAPQMLLALSTAGPEDQPATPTAAKAENPNGRKRFRTKFSQQQKEKMMSFSEKLGWKMQKCDEGLVEEFCNEVGVGKGVLRVWMHNNKHSFGKRDFNAATATTTTTTSNSNGRVLNFDNNITPTATNHRRHHHHDHHDNESNNGVHLHVSTNGSPSSA